MAFGRVSFTFFIKNIDILIHVTYSNQTMTTLCYCFFFQICQVILVLHQPCCNQAPHLAPCHNRALHLVLCRCRWPHSQGLQRFRLQHLESQVPPFLTVQHLHPFTKRIHQHLQVRLLVLLQLHQLLNCPRSPMRSHQRATTDSCP